ncbi:hypothetical protein [Dactylosporangium sp. NPDC049140]|uniref:hypothetical protein n=1 Tax=Dactylosporangium sp. NPDC049140 TaxID=3155647 RepID=UPI0033E07CD2
MTEFLAFAVRRWFGLRSILEAFAEAGRNVRDEMRRLAEEMRDERRAARWRRLAALRRGLRDRYEGWAHARAAAGGVVARPEVRARLRRLAWQAVRRYEHDQRRLAVAAVVTAALLFLGLPIWLLTAAGVPWMTQGAAILLAFVVLVGPAAYVPRFGMWMPPLAAAGLGAVLAVVPGGLALGPAPFPVVVLRVGLVQWLGLLLAVAEVVLAARVVNRRRMRRHPEIEAAELLNWLLPFLDPGGLATAGPRRAVARGLEQLAEVFEHGYAAALALPAADLDAELRGRLRRIAAGLRAQEVAVALPDAETVATLRRQLLACAGAVATGRLGSLAGIVDAEPRPVRRRVFATLAVLRSVAVALVPAAAVVLLHRAGLLLWDELGRGAAAVAAVWAVAVLLMALDPQFGPRVRAVRELLGLLRGEPRA